MKKVKFKDDKFINEIDKTLADHHHFHLYWLGQSGYLLQWKGQQVLIDPYLSDSLTKKYENTNKPHVRISERVVDPSLLKNISIVSSSHNHTDHLDGETLIPLIRNNPDIKFIIPEANRAFVAERVGCAADFPKGLNDWKFYSNGDFVFHGIPAKHNEIERDEKGNCKCMGYVIEFDQWRIYHSGDTILFDGMVEMLKPFEIDVAILPINGNDPSRGVAGNLSCTEAAKLGNAINARVVIPCHYDLFSFNTADPDEFAREAKSIAQPYHILQLGEGFSSSYFTE